MENKKYVHFREIIKKPLIRVIISVICSIVIIFGSSYNSSNKASIIRYIIIFVVVVASIIDATLSYIYGKIDQKDKFEKENMQSTINLYRDLQEVLSKQMYKEAEGVNGIAKSIQKEGILPGNRWTFERESVELCQVVYKFLIERIGRDSLIYVFYAKREDNKDNIIKTIGFANKHNEPPRNFRTERDIFTTNAYKDACLFRDGDPQPFYRFSSDEVDRVLHYNDREEESGRYEQCLLIPVMCENVKMVGLLEVFSGKGCVLMSNENEKDQLISDLDIFISIFLLLQKTYKAACAIPINISN